MDDQGRPAPQRDGQTVRAQLLGDLQVTTAHALLPRAAFPGLKPRRLLQVLLCERGHLVSKTRLTELLWEQSPPRDPAGALETYVSVLRRTLAPGAPSRASVIVTEAGGYRAGPRGLEVDLDEFDEHLRAAGTSGPAAALQHLRRALGLVRGPVLAGEPDLPWLRQLRTTYRDRHVRALADAGRLTLLSGDPGTALSLAQRAVLLNPLAEPGYHVLMASAYALWRQDEALAAYEQCRRGLSQELGVDPMEQTRSLHLAILRHEPVSELLAVLDVGRSYQDVRGSS